MKRNTKRTKKTGSLKPFQDDDTTTKSTDSGAITAKATTTTTSVAATTTPNATPTTTTPSPTISTTAPPATATATAVTTTTVSTTTKTVPPPPTTTTATTATIDTNEQEGDDVQQGKSVIIRQMELKDLSSVFQLGSSLFTSERAATLYRTWDEFEVAESFYDCPELCLIVELSGPLNKKDEKSRLLGFVLASVLEKNRKAICGYVQWIAVKQSYHRMHIGTMLMDEVMERMAPRNVHQVLADTPMVNTEALAFFKTLNFAEPEPHIYLHRKLHGDKPLLDTKHQASLKLTIRPMNLADLYPVFELGCELFSPEYNTLHRTWTEDEVLAFLLTDSENCLVAHIDDELMGFVLGTIVEKRVWHYGYLTWMGVSRKLQRGGVGKLMFAAFHDTVLQQGANMMLVDTQRSNTPAIHFFEKCGFKRDEDSEHCYFVRTLQPNTPKTFSLAVPKPLLGRLPRSTPSHATTTTRWSASEITDAIGAGAGAGAGAGVAVGVGVGVDVSNGSVQPRTSARKGPAAAKAAKTAKAALAAMAASGSSNGKGGGSSGGGGAGNGGGNGGGGARASTPSIEDGVAPKSSPRRRKRTRSIND